MKTVPIDLKKLTDVVSKEVIIKTVYNQQNTKVIKLENNVLDVSTLIQTNQYYTNKQNLQKKMVNMRTRYLKLVEIERKIPDTGGLVTDTVHTKTFKERENKICDYAKYITTPTFNKFAGIIFDKR